ncbi:DUF357 domain-containing protein [Nanoarchaeota archaeon]
MQEIKKAAEREMERMKEVFASLKIKKKGKAKDFYDFAKNYHKDGLYFYNKKMYVEAFEAQVIAWAYIDTGLKLGYFSAPKEQKEWFTA